MRVRTTASWIAVAAVTARCAATPPPASSASSATSSAGGDTQAAASSPSSAGGTPTSAAVSTPPAPAPRHGVAALFYELNGRQVASPLVRGTVAGRPVVYMLDTGASRHVVSAAMARQAGLSVTASTGRVQGHGADTVPLAFASHAGLTLERYGALGDDPVPVVPIPPAIEQLGISAFVSPQALATPAEAVVLALPEGELRAAPPAGLTATLATEGRTPAFARARRCADATHPESGAVFVVPATIDGQALELLVDTGARATAVYAASAAGQRFAPRAVATGITAQTVSGPLAVTMLRAARVDLGGFARVSDVVMVPGPPHVPLPGCSFDGVVGMDLLRHCALAFTTDNVAAYCRAGE